MQVDQRVDPIRISFLQLGDRVLRVVDRLGRAERSGVFRARLAGDRNDLGPARRCQLADDAPNATGGTHQEDHLPALRVCGVERRDRSQRDVR